MNGMHAKTGRTLSGTAHLIQSIHQILTTPTGARLMRRDFGCDLINLIDAPHHATTQAQVYAATATALMRWEPRLKLTRLQLRTPTEAAHTAVLDIEGVMTANGEALNTQIAFPRGQTA